MRTVGFRSVYHPHALPSGSRPSDPSHGHAAAASSPVPHDVSDRHASGLHHALPLINLPCMRMHHLTADEGTSKPPRSFRSATGARDMQPRHPIADRSRLRSMG